MIGVLLLIHLLSITGSKADEGKPFGTGVGPVFIGGRDTDNEGTQMALRIFGQYINYKVLSGEATMEDARDYKNYIADNLCIGTCPYHSSCQKGICVCNQGYQQVFGQCRPRANTSVLANFDRDDDAKYRKPTPPPLPAFCFCQERDSDTGNRRRVICRDRKFLESCKRIHYPNVFDDALQFCTRGDHNFCLSKDINMFCTDKEMYDSSPAFNTQRRVCGCRKEMMFDSQRMECRIHIGADCSGVVKTGYTNPNHLTEVLKGEEAALGGVTFENKDVLQGFCLLLDGQVDEYKAHLVGAGEEVVNSWSRMLMAMAMKAWAAIAAWCM